MILLAVASNFVFATIAIDLAILLVNFTAHVNASRNAFLSLYSEKNIFFDVDIVVKLTN